MSLAVGKPSFKVTGVQFTLNPLNAECFSVDYQAFELNNWGYIPSEISKLN